MVFECIDKYKNAHSCINKVEFMLIYQLSEGYSPHDESIFPI